MQFFISEIAHKIIGNIRIAAVDEKYTKKEGEIDDAEFCTVYPNESCIWKRHAKRSDTAKGIAIGAANPGTDIWEFWKKIMML